MGFGEADHRGKVPFFITSFQGHILSSRFMTVGVDIDHLADVVFVRFLYCMVILFSSLSIIFEGKSLCTALIYGVGMYAPSPWGQRVYINYFKFFSMDNLSLLLFVNLSNHLYISILTHKYLFYTLDYYPISLSSIYLFICPNCSTIGHWKLFHLAPLPTS